MMFRLPPVDGEAIDRSRPLRFRFEGRDYTGYAGDTISSALAANGLMTLARSFKYHRPRGLFSAAGHDANNLFQLGPEPNVRGDVVLLQEGMDVEPVNSFGALAEDRGRHVEKLARFLPVGFYYKAFGSARLFPRFEALIRRFSGLGRVDVAARPARRVRHHLHCDVAVVGAGLTGLAAAVQARRAGAGRVLLIDENPVPGGSARWARRVEPRRHERLAALLREVAADDGITLLPGHAAVGLYADRELAVSQVDRPDGALALVRAGGIVLATGVIEQPVVFRHNDLPGILLGSAAQRLLYRHGLAVGREVVVLGAQSDAITLALDLASRDLRVTTLALLAGSPVAPDAEQTAALQAAGIDVLAGCVPLEAMPDGRGELRGLRLRTSAGARDLRCDALLLSGGAMPAVHLALQAGLGLRHDPAQGIPLPDRLPRGVVIAGLANGVTDLDSRLADGAAAGSVAARIAIDGIDAAPRHADASRRGTSPQGLALPVFAHPRGKEFVDLDEDLTIADLRNAAQEGFDSIELLKRYSTVGMGPSQGKLSNLNAARILGDVTGADAATVGLTTARPPLHPVSLGALAGAGFAPLRRTALDSRHDALGAVWMPAGAWRRPAWYRASGANATAAARAEAITVRAGVGIIDVSTLGKIELRGRDAALLLERLYTGRYADLRVGATRYAVLLDESGIVADDGVVARLGEDHFYVSTTTGGAPAVYREMQRRAAEWRLQVMLHNLTGHRAALNVAGPASRELLEGIAEMDLSQSAFPYLGVRRGRLAGHYATVLRVGFVGELGYEIHVGVEAAGPLWDRLAAAGTLAPRPFGVEAQRLLRLEKGHVIIGQDTDGVTDPFEAGLGWALKRDKPFFVGQRSLDLLEKRGPRQRLAGFELDDASADVAECHLVIDAGAIAGRITSIGRACADGRGIGLALVAPRLATPGQRLTIRGAGGQLHGARVVALPFYDPDLARQRGGER